MNGLTSKVTITGEVRATLINEKGKIVESDTANLVVTTGKQHVADQLAGKIQAAMSHKAIGTGSIAAELIDTQLETEISRKPFGSKDQGTGANANQIVYITTWDPGEGDGAIKEAGIFNASSAGIMLCRTTFPEKNKGPGDTLVLTWTITVN